jgi:hypothetical protein
MRNLTVHCFYGDFRPRLLLALFRSSNAPGSRFQIPFWMSSNTPEGPASGIGATGFREKE